VPSRSIARSKYREIKRKTFRVITDTGSTMSKPGPEIVGLRRDVVVEAWGSCRQAVAEPWNLGRNDDASVHAPLKT
jgi:hypothetical protein